MAKDVTIAGATYTAVPGIQVPKSGGGDALFLDADDYAPLASPALTGTPTAPTATAGDNSTQIATTAYADTAVSNAVAKEILFFSGQTVSAANNAQICRIPSSGTNSAITADHVVLEAVWANPAYITSNVTWTSYAGYIVFTGTCTASTTLTVTLGKKGN